MSKAINTKSGHSPFPIEPILLLKSAVGMAFVALVVATAIIPEVAKTGLNWGQGIIAFVGGVAGALMSLKH
jgi:hypothetical protein